MSATFSAGPRSCKQSVVKQSRKQFVPRLPSTTCRVQKVQHLHVQAFGSAPNQIQGNLQLSEDMQEYQNLKSTMLDRTRNAGGILAVYLLIAVDGETALCSLIGTWLGYLYLLWLMRDVDNVKPTDVVPLTRANKIADPNVRFFARILAAWVQAFRPRLIVPIGMAAAVSLYNHVSPAPIDLLDQGCLLGGFLMYKASLVTLVADANLPKKYDTELPQKPRLSKIEDELDMYGRPKKSQAAVANDKILENVPESMDKPEVRNLIGKVVLGEEIEGK